ncbi:unnamed protein product [Trichobilharzia regenti]|nr:unnamed protein product [Trichobilharzia regenti]
MELVVGSTWGCLQSDSKSFLKIIDSVLPVSIVNQYHTSPSEKQSMLTEEHRAALRRLCENDDIVMFRPDKGSGIVIMNKTDYVHKMLTILNDSEKFQVDKTKKDATTSFKSKVNKCLKELLIKKLTDNKMYNELKSKGG